MQKTWLFLDLSLFYVKIWTYFIDSDLLPSFTLHSAIIPTLKYEQVNSTILRFIIKPGLPEGRSDQGGRAVGSSCTWTSICFLIGWAVSREEINTHAEACTFSPNEIHSTSRRRGHRPCQSKRRGHRPSQSKRRGLRPSP